MNPLDPRKLRPADLVRILNSTPLGTVTNERQVYRHRMKAGFKIGDGRHVDLLKYVAWLVIEKHTPKPPVKTYEDMKESARARNAAKSAAGRDIGELPDVADPERKARAEKDFKFFCETYFPETFSLAWSPDHLKVIAKVEQAVLHGGLFALAMPRGSGKTTIAECACLWAVLSGHQDFVCLIGSDEGHASDMLESIKTELDGNAHLLADFPEVIVPIEKLDGIAHRCNGQLYHGVRTHIGWTAKEVVLPTIPGSKGSGAIIKVAGLTGRIRGMKFKRHDGKTVRPSLVVLDDPQTDESARSVSQCQTRESILAGAILGLAGPGKKISGIMPCTVIAPDDMADRILNREKHPEWQGERTKMVYEFPENEKLWNEYARIRAECFRNDKDLSEATEFYRAHQAEMDQGARIAWPDRFNPDEISGIQHAMNLKLQDERAFYAEYQNEPLPEETPEDDMLTADQIMAKANGMAHGEVPIGCNHLTAFIDVQQKMLFYVIAAWEDDFTGAVIETGTFPKQSEPYFTLRDARRTLAQMFPKMGIEAQVYAGLEKLTGDILAREFRRDDGAMMKIDRCLIDANWGTSTDVVYQFSRQSKFSNIVLPSHGRYVGASSLPFSDYKKHKGDRVGLNWRIPNVSGKRAVRHVIFDTNYWKSFIFARLAVAMGDPGCLSLFGKNPELQRMMADHLTAEYRVRTSGRGRTVDEWKERPEKRDNHWLDCLTGCAVAASMQGAVLPGTDQKAEGPRARIKLSDLQRGRK